MDRFIAGIPRRSALTGLGAVAAALVLAACSAPGGSASAAATSGPVSTDVGSGKITLSILVDTPGVAGTEKLGALFTQKYPNVTIKVSGDEFTNLISNASRTLSSGTVPDITRTSLGVLVKDNLLQPLDGYAKLYGWDRWPASQFASSRSNAKGSERGTGSLYAVGNGYGLTGVYYNKKILKKIGASVPATLADFEKSMAKAKSAGYAGIVTNGKDGGVAYPLQNLAIDYGGVAAISDWTNGKAGASVKTPAMIKAAQTIQDWSDAGYLVSGVNSLDTTSAPAEFAKGKSLFYTSGNWQAPSLQKSMGSDVGFMLFPAQSASQPQYAMSASESLVIPAKAEHKDAAAAFLNFIQTDSRARQITVDDFGLAPGGAAGAETPDAVGVVKDTLTAFAAAVKKDAVVDFLGNSTTSMSLTLIPQTQLLVTGKTTPAAFAAKLQSEYANQTGQ